MTVPGSPPQQRFGPEHLAATGPKLVVEVGVPKPLAEALVKQGVDVPQAIVGNALVDTGATHTCVDRDAAIALGLAPVGVVQVFTPSGSEDQSIYPIRLGFVGAGLGEIETLPALGSALQAQDILVLIGRDVLSQCVLLYNGPGGHWTITL